MGQGKCRILNVLFTVALLGAGGFAIWYFLGKPTDAAELNDAVGDALDGFDFGNFGNFTDVLDGIGNFSAPDLWDNDPYLSDNTTQSWKTSGQGGLELELLNALDDSWQGEFAVAVTDWEEGDPDSLTLTTKKVNVDYACKPVDGVMKVCNGNYGNSGWLGINEIVSQVSNGRILSSVAKMNEYYLLNADEYERQFTMCHELGHGFGLPHTDESFTNVDLGNCMDYTNTPKNNLHPDSSNYNRLASLYGTVSNRRTLRERVSSERVESTPFEVKEQYGEAVSVFHVERMTAERPSGWRVLQEHHRGASYARNLGEDYELTVHVLGTLLPSN
eukprot:CAMPEP_0117021000 /NCGR_PEP_ID=MMETSP0472-20121206/15892_1 /TAXON_ID=693140 ORGANISM="Tiarina fusus, Strain LIS" /NCGR_SAMPLE_ID=MMETSP0472 /ASSEMBLY_ACC=CAM_ASM_000603 /LENGTH=330 /DNA_ID=CAMNT_0004726355 /DNA_START=118 /DNA_END=1110 /DNA_ORIENTATION=+